MLKKLKKKKTLSLRFFFMGRILLFNVILISTWYYIFQHVNKCLFFFIIGDIVVEIGTSKKKKKSLKSMIIMYVEYTVEISKGLIEWIF